jgi:hypothetical protein
VITSLQLSFQNKENLLQNYCGNGIELTSAINGREWSVSSPYRFNSGERDQDTHWIRGWAGPRTGLGSMAKRKISFHCRESNRSRPLQSLYRLSCPISWKSTNSISLSVIPWVPVDSANHVLTFHRKHSRWHSSLYVYLLSPFVSDSYPSSLHSVFELEGSLLTADAWVSCHMTLPRKRSKTDLWAATQKKKKTCTGSETRHVTGGSSC